MFRKFWNWLLMRKRAEASNDELFKTINTLRTVYAWFSQDERNSELGKMVLNQLRALQQQRDRYVAQNTHEHHLVGYIALLEKRIKGLENSEASAYKAITLRASTELSRNVMRHHQSSPHRDPHVREKLERNLSTAFLNHIVGGIQYTTHPQPDESAIFKTEVTVYVKTND